VQLGKKINILHESSSVVMLSGGIDSVAVLKQVLKETDDKIYAHHIHIKNNEGPNNIKRYKAEALALRKIVPYMKKTFRDFNYSESTIDTRQIFSTTQSAFLNITMPGEEEFVKKHRLTSDIVYNYFIAGLLAKTTNSANTYTGDINLLSPIYYPYVDKDRLSKVVKKKYIVNKREIKADGKCNISLNAKPIPGEIDTIFNTTAWPHKSNLIRPLHNNTCNHNMIKMRNVQYLGKKLMGMVWYCRWPTKKNEKILSCNNIYGFYSPTSNDKTGQVFKCKACEDVTTVYLELREEQEQRGIKYA